MANTKRTTLDLDNDAVELLARLAPSADRQGKLVSDLIRAAAQAPPTPTPASVHEEIAELNRQSVELIKRRRAGRETDNPNVIIPMTPEERQGLIELLRSWREDAKTIDPLEAEADLEDLKRALNENRYPEPPLFL
jgi:hypothetical protein